MDVSRRRLLSVTAAATASALAGCVGGRAASGAENNTTTAQASFFVFGDIAEQVAGEAATTELLVPVGQHGHGWEPGPRVRERIRNSSLLFHGMPGFQPWVDSITTDLDVDAPDVTAVDVSAGLDLLEPGTDHDHEDGHDEDHDGHEGDHNEDHEGDHGAGMDPHFWMDPLRVNAATGTVQEGFVGIDPDNEDAYNKNADAVRRDLEDLHGRIEALVANAAKDVLLVAGHDSFQYFGDRYGIEVEALTSVSPDDRPTPRDIERAQDIIDQHDLRYICADPLESQQAATQLVAETDAEAVVPLTAMPGVTATWADEDWGYVDVMRNVNVPTLERALGNE